MMPATAARVAALNDRCRQGRDPTARIVVTRTCLARFAETDHPVAIAIAQATLLGAVRSHVFTEAEGVEHDRGSFRVAGVAVRFKIDCYDRTLEWSSPDPADPAVTTRVLTLMLPEDD